MDFKNLNDLARFLEQKANSALKNEVAEAVVEEMQEQIEDVVYSVYEPKVYERQGYQGGLTDPRNIEVEIVNDNTISVENIRHDGDREVAQIVESGVGYEYPVPTELLRGRKFTKATRESLHHSEKLKYAMQRGLKRQGIKSD